MTAATIKRRRFLSVLAGGAASTVVACDEGGPSTSVETAGTPAPDYEVPQVVAPPSLDVAPDLFADPFARASVLDVPATQLADGCVVEVRTADGEIACVSPDGRPRWSQPMGPDEDVVAGRQAVAWNDGVAILDRSDGVVVALGADGSLQGRWPEGDALFAPWDAAALGSDLLVSDPSAQRVVRFDTRGRLSVFAEAPADGTGAFNGPAAIAMRTGEVLVSDLGNARVCRFAADGTLLGHFGSPADGLASPRGLAVDALGRVFVADPVAGAVFRYERDTLVDVWRPTRDDGTPLAPTRVHIAADGTLSIVSA